MKLFFKILSFVIISCYLQPNLLAEKPYASKLHQQSNASSQQEKASLIALQGVICLLLGEFLSFSADEQSKHMLHEQIQYKNIIKNFLSNYGEMFIATICHEFGHAITSKILNGDPIDIHVGANSTDGSPILNLGFLSIDGLDARKGYCNHEIPCENRQQVHDTLTNIVGSLEHQKGQPKPMASQINSKENLQDLIQELKNSPSFQGFRKKLIKVNPFKQGLILLAGGTFGIIGHFLTKAIPYLIAHGFDKGTLKQAVSHACKLDFIYTNQLINMLVPFDVAQGKSDASKFWEDCIGVNASIVRSIEDMAPSLEIAAEQYLARYQATNADATIHTKALVGLINYLQGGFIRLHV